MMFARGLLLISLASLAFCKPMARNMKVREMRKAVPDGFKLRAAAQPETIIDLRLALVQSNFAELESRLIDVSSPSSPNYGKHLSKAEVQQLVAPKKESTDAVSAWLAEHDITPQSKSGAGDWIALKVPVSKANELLDADFSVFEHEGSGLETIRTLSYSIPAELQGHLDLVHPTVGFPNPHNGPLSVISAPPKGKISEAQDLTSRDIPSSCAETITPACLQALYHIPTTPATQTSNKLAVTGFQLQYVHYGDLSAFLTSHRPDMPTSTNFTLEGYDNGRNPQNTAAGPEATLDIEYTVGIATGVPITFMSVGYSFHDHLLGFLDLMNYYLEQDAPPNVVTTSYGADEHLISRDLAVALCNAHAQLGARGVTIIFSSGDGGVAGHHNATCADDNFVPAYPSICPYVTSVGATRGIPETGAYFSAGGFSNYFATPDYQADAVKSYIAGLGDTYSGKYNTSGRGYPDVSAQGYKYEIFINNEVQTISGTSAAAPFWAAVVSLLNDRLIAAGKSPLGFLNPFLYSKGASALNDITSGSNPGCDTDGFSAKAGWDPVTGLGTPDFDKLLKAVGL